MADDLNNQQLERLQKALYSAYGIQGKDALDQLVWAAERERLDDIAEGGTIKAKIFNLTIAIRARGRVKRLVELAIQGNPGNDDLCEIATELGVTAPARETGAYAPASHTPPYELADTSTFDLTDLDQVYWEAVDPTPELTGVKRLIGFGLTYGDEPFLTKLRHRLAGHLGAHLTEDRPTFDLHPKRFPPKRVVEDLLTYKETLQFRHNLIVVRGDTADDVAVAELWKAVCEAFPGRLDSFLILLIVKDSADAFPAQMVRLPRPSFKFTHVRAWTNQVMLELRKQDARWEPPATWAERWSRWIHQRSRYGDELDTRKVYKYLDDDLARLKKDPERFLQELGKVS